MVREVDSACQLGGRAGQAAKHSDSYRNFSIRAHTLLPIWSSVSSPISSPVSSHVLTSCRVRPPALFHLLRRLINVSSLAIQAVGSDALSPYRLSAFSPISVYILGSGLIYGNETLLRQVGGGGCRWSELTQRLRFESDKSITIL